MPSLATPNIGDVLRLQQDLVFRNRNWNKMFSIQKGVGDLRKHKFYTERSANDGTVYNTICTLRLPLGTTAQIIIIDIRLGKKFHDKHSWIGVELQNGPCKGAKMLLHSGNLKHIAYILRGTRYVPDEFEEVEQEMESDHE